MSEIKKYLNEEGLGVVASEINTKLTQFTTMPTASADYTGKIIQYIGNSTNTYTQGFFYTSTIDDDTADPVTYKWQEIELSSNVTLTFDDNDFDVDNNNVALSAAQRIFTGTTAEWEALTTEQKANYTVVNFTDSIAEGGAVVVDEVTNGNLNAVTSNAVYNAINRNPQIKKFQSGIWTGVVAIASQTKQTVTITMPEAMPSTNYFVVLACPDISIWGIFKRVISTTQFDISLYNFHTAAVNAQNITWNAIEIG